MGAQQNKSLEYYAEHGKAREVMRDLDVLIIDEISMVGRKLFERLDVMLNAARSSEKALSGVQTILFDFRQPPPVKPFEFCITCGRKREETKRGVEMCCEVHGSVYEKNQWAFRSEIWTQLRLTNILLRHVHHQTNETFSTMLNHL